MKNDKMQILLFISTICTVCTRIFERKSADQLSQYEKQALTTAMKKFWDSGRIVELAYKHEASAGTVHASPVFLHWHRLFLHELQQELFLIDQNAIMPYWEWSFYYRNPEYSPIFRDDFFGGNGNPGGKFKGTYFNYDGHQLTRQFSQGGSPGEFASRVEINNILTKQFDEFSYLLEYIHGYVHSGMGGDMLTMKSPLDPDFFVHHMYIDKIWDDWRKMHQRDQQYKGDIFGRQVNEYDIVPDYDVTVMSTYDTEAEPFCFRYVPSGNERPFRSRNRMLLRSGEPGETNSTALTTDDILTLKDSKGVIKPLGKPLNTTFFLTESHWTRSMQLDAKKRIDTFASKVNKVIGIAKKKKAKGKVRGLENVTFK